VQVLQRVISTTEVTKNVNKNNATHGVLFEAINVIIHEGKATELLMQAVQLLGRFISIREANIRYLGLETMAKLSQHPECAEDVKRHNSTILFSLKDADVSIRRRALDLVYSMCDYSNCRETIAELLSYLANADFSLREELVLKIAILAERFADDYAWYVDVVLALMKTAGEQVSDEIWYRVVQIITNEEALQKYATENVFKALLDDTRPPNNLVRICAYLLGEFGHLVANEPKMSSHEQFASLHAQWATSDMPTRALLLSTYVKLGHIYPELEGDVARVFNTCRSTLDQELQQRALEYSALSSPGLADLKATVLEMMPAFPERESAVLKRIKVRSNDETGRGRGDIVADKIAREDSAGEAHHTSSGGGGGGGGGGDLLGDVGSAPQLQIQQPQMGGGLDDMLGGLDLSGGSAPSMPPSNSQSNGLEDMLGMMGEMAPMQSNSNGGGLADMLRGGGGGGLLMGSNGGGGLADMLGGGGGSVESPTFISLCVRSEGVLYEDAMLQIGIKSEFLGPQGKLVLFYGNKSPTSFMQFMPSIEQTQGVSVQASTVPQALQANTQVQQMLQLECTGPFGTPPSLKVSFTAGMAQKTVRVLLPVAPTKFCAPLSMEGPQFFAKWNSMPGPLEAQKVCNLLEKPSNMNLFNELTAKGLKLAVLQGVDPSAANLVAIGCVSLKGKAQSECPLVAMRIELNVPVRTDFLIIVLLT